MVCRTCNNESSHIITRKGIDSCHVCGGFRESSRSTSGILTRNSLRVRQAAVLGEGDTIHPYEYDKARRKPVPSKDFIKKYAHQSHEYFTDNQLRDAGHNTLPIALAKRQDKIRKQIEKEESKVRFEGDAAARQKELLA